MGRRGVKMIEDKTHFFTTLTTKNFFVCKYIDFKPELLPWQVPALRSVGCFRVGL